MSLYDYMQDTQRLIGDLKQEVENQASIIRFVNIARKQVAGESEAIRVVGTLALSSGTNAYSFSAINISGTAGVDKVFNVRTVWVVVGAGQLWLRPRSFPWFSLYYLNSVIPAQARPSVWAQFGQGETGSLYFGSTPDATYTAKCDCSCSPTDLAQNTDTEALPQPWQFAVPYFAAYLCYLEAQRPNEADKMLALYEEFTNRARRMSTPSILPGQYEQVPNMSRPNQLGLVRKSPMQVQ